MVNTRYILTEVHYISTVGQSKAVALVNKQPVLKDVREVNSEFDYVVCAHKAIDQASVPPQLEAAVDDKGTMIVIIQNGVGNEVAFRKQFPSTTILSAVVSSPWNIH